MDMRETTVSTKTIYDGKIITVDDMQGENVETYKKLQYAHLFDRDRILKNFYE